MLLPGLAARRRRVDVRRGRDPRDVDPVDPQPRLSRRRRCVAHGARRRRPSVHRDGLASHARGGSGRSRARRVHHGVRGLLQPRGGTSLRRADDGHVGARVHAAARRRARRVHRAGRLARQGHDAARRHLRREERRQDRRRGRGPRTRWGASGFRRPARAGPRGARAARLTRCHKHEDRRDERPRRVRHRRPRSRAGRRVRRRHLPRHRLRRADGRHGLQARPARGRRRPDDRRREEEQGQDLRRRTQVGAASPKRTGSGRGRDHRHRRAAGRRRRRPCAARPARQERRGRRADGRRERPRGVRACPRGIAREGASDVAR